MMSNKSTYRIITVSGGNEGGGGVIRWHHWLLYDIRARIVYATLLGILLGIGLTLLIYLTLFNKTEVETYGGCLIKTPFR
jgi:hypothetical protein